MAKTAADSARDWRMHASAQWGLDDGSVTYAKAETMWATSKARGDADVAAFRKADAAYAAIDGKCAGTAAATEGSEAADEGAACAARGAAVAKVYTTGRAVNSQWAAHMIQMQGKAQNAGHEYHQEWLRRTSAAKPALADYDAAAKELAAAPACAS